MKAVHKWDIKELNQWDGKFTNDVVSWMESIKEDAGYSWMKPADWKKLAAERCPYCGCRNDEHGWSSGAGKICPKSYLSADCSGYVLYAIRELDFKKNYQEINI